MTDAHTTTTTTEQMAAAAPQPSTALVKAASFAAGNKIQALVPTTIEEAWRLAQYIAAGGWAPKAYQVGVRKDATGRILAKNEEIDPNKVMTGIMQGLEVGLTPLMALQSIAVINGMPSLWGDGALAVVRASGQLEGFRETFIYDDKGKCVGATCWVKRKGEEPAETTFTEEDARQAGLLGKDGPWKQYTKRMYQMRARAWRLRDSFTDVMRGMGVAEEMQDYVDITPNASHSFAPTTQQPSAKSALDRFARSPEPGAAAAATTDAVDTPLPAEVAADSVEPEKASGPTGGGASGVGTVNITDAGPAEDTASVQDDDADHALPDGCPAMPADAWAAFNTHGKWIHGWKWLNGCMVDKALQPAQRLAIARHYVLLVHTTRSYNDQYRKAVDNSLLAGGIKVFSDDVGGRLGLSLA